MRAFFPSVLIASCAFVQTHARGLWSRQSTTHASSNRSCGQSLCVTATVNGSSVNYVLSNTGRGAVGWMGVGFGTRMPNTPMVIMWANSDGSITLSQRSAPGHVMPMVDNNPARVATLEQSLSSTSSNNIRFAFSIPSNGESTQNIIYALGATNPGSAAVDAALQQHINFGTGQLDLTTPISTQPGDNSTQPGDNSTQPGDSPVITPQLPLDELPLLPYQRLIVAHAIFCTIGFLLFLPAGSLIGRYLRTFTPTWFTGHWIAQFALAGPMIVVGFALGVSSVNEAGAEHLNDPHKRLGVALFVLYGLQCSLGATIHWVKPKKMKYRPPQNYAHAICGLLIIALALYQVRTGYHIEWPSTTGRPPLPNGVDVIFWIWVALLPVSYGLGLLFLRKQFRQERNARGQSKSQETTSTSE